MKIIGFNLNKISAESLSNDFKELKINTNIKIEDIESAKSDIFKKDEEAINIKFNYLLDYTPSIAKLAFSGSIVMLVNEKESKNILKQWENKKIPDAIKLPLFNIILRKTNIKALELEDELNLPLHIALPSLKPQKKE
jgi:hypothetical protein